MRLARLVDLDFAGIAAKLVDVNPGAAVTSATAKSITRDEPLRRLTRI